MTQRHVRIEYTLREEIDVEAYKEEASRFARNVRAHHPRNAYDVYQHEKQPRRFTHVGAVDGAASAAMQKEPWFEAFAARLRAQTVAPPDVQPVAPIAPSD